MWYKYLFIIVMFGVIMLMCVLIGLICESEGGCDFICNVFEEFV